ncbi:MAG: RHS repeat protein [Cyanobacteria bacterium SZAS LIN-2]|nr:RHS repeat protein [Cyanobacteria bacterium SZAS LIN-2]
MLALVTSGGATTTLSYNSDGSLASITGPFGHQLIFGYSSGNISSVTDPAGAQIQYGYDSHGNLSTVTYQDGAVRTYVYENASFPHHLTGIIDESSNRYSTYGYDSNGRVTSSTHAGGADAIAVTSYTATSSTLTDVAGDSVQLGFTTNPGYTRRANVITRNGLTRSYTIPAPTTDPQQRATQVVDENGNLTTSVFDADHLTSKTEAFGTSVARTTTYQYLSAVTALPTLVTEPLRTSSFQYYAGTNNVHIKTVTDTTVQPNVSRSWTYVYDSYGRILSVDGPRTDVTDVTTYSYFTCSTGGSCGHLNIVTDAVGNTTTYTSYNAHGQPTQLSDQNSVVTTLAYDARLRLTDRCVNGVLPVCVGGELTHLDYWPTGLLKKSTLPDGSYLLYSYDNAHRLTQVTDGAGNKMSYTLDAAGNRTAESAYDPTNTLSRTHNQVYNVLNQLYQDIGAAGTSSVTTTFGYDNNGNQISVSAPLGRLTTSKYDPLNRLSSVTDANGGVTAYQYDANDSPTQLTDPRNLVTAYTPNGFGEVQQVTSPDTGSTSNTYDSGGNLATSTNARTGRVAASYDAINRVRTLSYSVNGVTDQIVTFSYDGGTDGRGRLTGASDANHTMTWGYDALGRLTSKGQAIGTVTKTVGYGYVSGDLTTLTTPSGQSVVYSYANHRITGIAINGTTLLSSVVYEPFGPARGWTWGNATTEIRLHDTDGDPSQISSTESSSYQYDDAHRITGITNSSNPVLSWGYGYDSLDRLNSGDAFGTLLAWTFDANGNRVKQTGAPAAAALTPANLVLTYNGASRLATSKIGTSATTTYVYNALGQRIEKSGGPAGTVMFVYDEAGHLLGEYDGSGGLIQETIWLGDTPVATIRPNAGSVAVYYTHADHLNAPRMVTRSSDNASVWRWDHDPFGSAAPNQNPSGNGTFIYNLRFPGQYYDSESGLRYNYFRDYDPQTGRYVESDPIGLQGGINTYSYGAANPVSHIDPTGLDCTAVGGTVTCTPPGGPTISFPRPPGWPDYVGPNSASYHSYNESANTSGTTKKCLEDYIRTHPTPGSVTSPATPAGTGNDATPDYLSWYPSPSPVLSYLTTSNGTQVVVNVTMPGHPLFPGYVARTVQSGPTNNQMNNYGEGLAWKQSGWNPLNSLINNVWQKANDAAYRACSCQH